MVKELLKGPDIKKLKTDLGAYVQSVERILGMKKGKFRIVDTKTLEVYAERINKLKEEKND